MKNRVWKRSNTRIPSLRLANGRVGTRTVSQDYGSGKWYNPLLQKIRSPRAKDTIPTSKWYKSLRANALRPSELWPFNAGGLFSTRHLFKVGTLLMPVKSICLFNTSIFLSCVPDSMTLWTYKFFFIVSFWIKILLSEEGIKVLSPAIFV